MVLMYSVGQREETRNPSLVFSSPFLSFLYYICVVCWFVCLNHNVNLELEDAEKKPLRGK